MKDNEQVSLARLNRTRVRCRFRKDRLAPFTSRKISNALGSTFAFALLLVLPMAASGTNLILEYPSAVSSLNGSGANYGPFFATTAGGFPSHIAGIANGQLNKISFPTAEHGVVDINFSAPLSKNADRGPLTITSPIDLFGLANGLIVGNVANSGAEDITGISPVPEPAPAAMFGIGMISLVGLIMLRKRPNAFSRS
jgi:hypothetical protein